MKQLPLAAAVALATVAMSSQAAVYTSVATSNAPTATPKPIVTVLSSSLAGSSNTFYTNPTPGGASVSTAPAIQLIRSGGWTFDFTNLAAVTFTGEIEYGNYETQTNVSSLAGSMQGHIVYTGVTQSFSGVGSYNEATNTFTYVKAAGASNSGGGSVYSATAPATCKSVGTVSSNTVCGGWALGTPAWEGLNLNFVFSEDRSTFSGKLIGTEKSQVSGVPLIGTVTTTTTMNWNIVGEVPVPAAAWLFGSALVGLAGIKRRKA